MKIEIDTNMEAKHEAKTYAGQYIPNNLEIVGMVVRDGIRAGACLRLKNNRLVQYNCGIIKQLPF